MPAISTFYGIIIQMLFFDSDRHNKPHIHVRYGEFKSSIDIETAEILAGELRSKLIFQMVRQGYLILHHTLKKECSRN